MEEILNNTPYNSYRDLFSAIYSGKATLNINRSDCIEIASTKSNFLYLIETFLGIILSSVLIIISSFFTNNFWMCLFIPFLFFLNYIIVYLTFIKYIATLIILFAIFIQIPLWIVILAASILVLSFGYDVWWKITYKKTLKILENNEDYFLWAWNRAGISIQDSYGNIYNILSEIKNK